MRPDLFLAECSKFDAELDQEIRIDKSAAAELDEEEQNPERLRRWLRDPRRRDLPVAPSQQEAERRLKEREERLGEVRGADVRPPRWVMRTKPGRLRRRSTGPSTVR
jgi:hypothetical protein